MRKLLVFIVTCILALASAVGAATALHYHHQLVVHKDYIGAVSSIASVFAFAVGAIALILNWYAIETSVDVAKKQKAYEIISKFIEDPYFVACRHFIEKELRQTELYELLISDPDGHRHTPVTIRVAGQDPREEPVGIVIDTVSHFFDRLGTLAVSGTIDITMPAMMFGRTATTLWNILKPILKTMDSLRTKRMRAEGNPLRKRGTHYQCGFAFFVLKCPKINPWWKRRLLIKNLYQ